MRICVREHKNESARGSEIKETKSPAEALELVEEFYSKYKD